jgi:hypothetical protein
MITWIIVLSWLAFIIVAINVGFKIAFVHGLKKVGRWCPRNKWYFSEDRNYAISFAWYDTIAKAQEAGRVRMRDLDK